MVVMHVHADRQNGSAALRFRKIEGRIKFSQGEVGHLFRPIASIFDFGLNYDRCDRRCRSDERAHKAAQRSYISSIHVYQSIPSIELLTEVCAGRTQLAAGHRTSTARSLLRPIPPRTRGRSGCRANRLERAFVSRVGLSTAHTSELSSRASQSPHRADSQTPIRMARQTRTGWQIPASTGYSRGWKCSEAPRKGWSFKQIKPWA